MNLLVPSIFASLNWLRAGMTCRNAMPAYVPRTHLAQRLPQILNLPQATVVVGQQTHSASLAVISRQSIAGAIPPSDAGHLLEIPVVDGLITRDSGILIGIFTADCVPVIIVDPVERTIAAVHAGREGTRGGIVHKAVEEMMRLGAQPTRMLAWIAPSISQSHYEVSPAMAQEFRSMLGEDSGDEYVKDRCLDLGSINRKILIEARVSAGNIELDPRCAFEREDLFYSYRRDGAGVGRMFTYAVITQ